MLGSQTEMGAVATRRCSSLNKAGEPCGAVPLTGSDQCVAHDSKSPAFHRFQPGAPAGPGRPKKLTITEAYNEALIKRVGDEFEELLNPLFAALKAAKENGEADHAIRLRADEMLTDRLVGKPKQATELTGANGGPVTLGVVDLTSDAELARYGRRDAE